MANKEANNKHAKQLKKKSAPFSKNDNIAIIGGGAGGLHIAQELIKKGYTNITIFEKESKVGGNAHTFTYNGGQYNTGVVEMMDSNLLVHKLMKEVGVYDDTEPEGYSAAYSHLSNKWLNRIELTGEQSGIKNVSFIKSKLRQLVRWYCLSRFVTQNTYIDTLGSGKRSLKVWWGG